MDKGQDHSTVVENPAPLLIESSRLSAGDV